MVVRLRPCVTLSTPSPHPVSLSLSRFCPLSQRCVWPWTGEVGMKPSRTTDEEEIEALPLRACRVVARSRLRHPPYLRVQHAKIPHSQRVEIPRSWRVEIPRVQRAKFLADGASGSFSYGASRSLDHSAPNSSLMSRRDPSRMSQEHRHSSCSTGDDGRRRDLDSTAARGKRLP